MEAFASSAPLENRDSESDWSDINSDQEERSLRIDLKDEEDTNISTSTTPQQQKLTYHKNSHRKRSGGFSATASTSSKKSKL